MAKIVQVNLVYDNGTIAIMPWEHIRQLVKGFMLYWISQSVKSIGSKFTVSSLFPQPQGWPACLQVFWDTYSGGKAAGQQMGRIVKELADEFGYRTQRVSKYGNKLTTEYEIPES